MYNAWYHIFDNKEKHFFSSAVSCSSNVSQALHSKTRYVDYLALGRSLYWCTYVNVQMTKLSSEKTLMFVSHWLEQSCIVGRVTVWLAVHIT